jgi:hypothetical protein
MEDMQKLWEHGVNVWDGYKKERFNLKVIIFCTINNNPACLALTGQVKEKTRCVVCVDQMDQFIFHLQVSWCTCGIIDSYHLNTCIT